MPIFAFAAKGYESDMAAVLRDFQVKVSALFRFLNRVAFRGKKWVVPRIDEQGRYLDVRQELAGAALSPIVHHVPKSVNGARIKIVELLECFHGQKILQAERRARHGAFRFHFTNQFFDKPSHIESVSGLGHLPGAGFKITRN